MTTHETKVYLSEAMFSEREKPLVETGPLSASAFRFPSGVCGLRLHSDAGELVMLPFQGQQIWSARFLGRELTMKSMFTEPRPTQDFLATFGAFYVHCGLSGVGGPSKEDTHPLHGELPNARYQTAYAVTGNDDGGAYIGLGGTYQHTITFSSNYIAKPLVKLYAGSTLLRLSMDIANLKNSEMEYMYLGHANFRPQDNSRLVYSAVRTPEHVRVRASIPSHIRPRPGYREFIEELKHHPERADVLAPGLAFDPEIAFFLDYVAGPDGWAHTLQVHPDGTADYLRHRPAQLDKGTRWMCRTADLDALGFEPATCEPEGYLAEKAKGHVKVLPAHGSYHCDLEIGSLSPEQAAAVEAQVTGILAQ